MQLQPKKKLYTIEVELSNGLTKLVKVKAIDREHAEQRALKFNPTAVGVKRNV